MQQYLLNTETQQLDFLLALGRVLDEWVTPGSANDFWVEGQPLITRANSPYLEEVRNLQGLFVDNRPRKVIDVLMARMMRIVHADTRAESVFIATPAQRHYDENVARKNIVLKSGKIGFSARILLRLLTKTITHTGRNALVISHDDDSVKKVLFPMAHFALDHMPNPIGEKLRKGALRQEFSSVNEIYFPALNSRFRVASAGNKNAGVSSSFQYLHASEVSRWDKHDPKQLVANLLSHLTGDDQEVHFESRPNGDVGVFPEMYWAAKKGDNDFKPHFYEWYWDASHKHKRDEDFLRANKGQTLEQFTLTEDTKDEEGKVVKLGEKSRAEIYARKYVGRSKETGLPEKLGKRYFSWYREKEKDLKDKVGQEYAENEVECFKSSGNNPFSQRAISDITMRDETPIDIETAEGKLGETNGLWIYKQPEEGKKYILFMDTAGGKGTSRSAFHVLEWETLDQAAEYVGRLSYEAQPGMLRTVGLRYNNALIAVENNHGKATGTIAIGLATYNNVYYHQVGDSKVFGWPTEKNRDEMLDHTVEFVKDYYPRIHSTRLAQELKTAETVGDKIQAKKGYTFDLVMAYAGALCVRRTFGRTIAPWFEVLGLAPPKADAKVDGGTDTGWNRAGGGIGGGDGFGNASDGGKFGSML